MSDWHLVNDGDMEEEYACVPGDKDFTIIKEARPKDSSSSLISDRESEQSNDTLDDNLPLFLRGEPTKLKFDRFLEKHNPATLVELEIRGRDHPERTTISTLFSFDQNPRMWFMRMVTIRSSFNIEFRILRSIALIRDDLRVPGLLRTIIWANAIKCGPEEDKFWRKVERAALNMLEDEAYLVHLAGDLMIFDGEIEGDQRNERKERNTRDEAYCSITKVDGFESIKFEDGTALARIIQGLVN